MGAHQYTQSSEDTQSSKAESPETLTQAIRQKAYSLGFDLCRIIAVDDAPHADFFQQWLAADRAGEMAYLTRFVDKRRSPQKLAAGDQTFHSLIVLAVDYRQGMLPAALLDDPSRGIIASYAWGDDYHEIIRPLLYELDAFIRAQTGRSVLGKGLVDTGPVLERDWAHRAGIGFTGKNCCTIHPQLGSWLFLATLLVPEGLAYDPIIVTTEGAPAPAAVLAGLLPTENYGRWEIPLADRRLGEDMPPSREGTCGRCTRCLDACPTDAFVGPFHLDPQRCISYWTIEAQGSIPLDLRRAFGNRIFGCDICQEVCPWNGRLAPRSPRLAGLQAKRQRMAPPLLEGFAPATPYWLDAAAFAEHFRRSPVKRAKRHGMLRNVCVALGNWGDPAAIPALHRALADEHPLPRRHAAWALGEIGGKVYGGEITALLQSCLAVETDDYVRAEIEAALAAMVAGP